MHPLSLPFVQPRFTPPPEKAGAVYTKAWVVNFILDLAGYTVDANIVDNLAVEPSAGEGGFLIAMAERLVRACVLSGRPWGDCANSILAYEISERSALTARRVVADRLVQLMVPPGEAASLANGWVRVGDYLVDAPRLPAAGFVIGNPPYIRLEDMEADALAFYRQSYPTMTGRADIYVAFYEAALRQLREGGVCAYICADRWLSNQYGAELRRFIADHFGVEEVVEMHRADAFEDDVSAYPAVTVIRRGVQRAAVVASLDGRAQTVPSSEVARAIHSERAGTPSVEIPGLALARVEGWLDGSDPWPCTSPQRVALLRRLEAEFQPLEDESTGTRVSIGVATGCDRVFITTKADLVEPSRLLPLGMVADTRDGVMKWSGHFLVDPWDEKGLVSLRKYPRLRAYLEAHEADLRGRNVAKRRPDTWYRTIDRVHHTLTTRHKLYFPDIRDVIHPVLDRGDTYPHHNLYYVVSDKWDLEVLGGLLMSRVGQFFVEVYGVRMRGGWLRFQAQYLRRIRVPRPHEVTESQAVALREAFRARDAERATLVACEIYRIDTAALGGADAEKC